MSKTDSFPFLLIFECNLGIALAPGQKRSRGQMSMWFYKLTYKKTLLWHLQTCEIPNQKRYTLSLTNVLNIVNMSIFPKDSWAGEYFYQSCHCTLYLLYPLVYIFYTSLTMRSMNDLKCVKCVIFLSFFIHSIISDIQIKFCWYWCDIDWQWSSFDYLELAPNKRKPWSKTI